MGPLHEGSPNGLPTERCRGWKSNSRTKTKKASSSIREGKNCNWGATTLRAHSGRRLKEWRVYNVHGAKMARIALRRGLPEKKKRAKPTFLVSRTCYLSVLERGKKKINATPEIL